jgi:DNA-binding NarL/FixJ family response regulator
MTEASGHSTETPAAPRLRLLIADDHPQVLEEIRELLASEFEVVKGVAGGIELVHAAVDCRPDAVVSDISMPDLDGIEAGRRILEAGVTDAVVLLTMHNDPQLLRRALDVGIGGFILKVDAGEELIEAVRAVKRGDRYISRSVRTR